MSWLHSLTLSFFALTQHASAETIGRVLKGYLSRFKYRRYQRAVVTFQATLRRCVEPDPLTAPPG